MCRGSACRGGRWPCSPISWAAEPLRGRFVTLEGGEGAGKSTQALLLAEALRAEGREVALTREPGGSQGAEAIRDLLLGGATPFMPEAEVLLHFAARFDHVARLIRPALERGAWVIADRFADSTLAYQGWGLGADRDLIADLTRRLGFAPDLTLILEVPEDVAAARLRARDRRDDRYERLDAAFHRRVAAGFRAIAAAEPGRCVLVDGNGEVSVVHGRVMEALRRAAARF